MNKLMTAATSVLAGAGLAYILDPVSGRRRRSILVDKGFHFSRAAGRGLAATGRDLSHRAQGVLAEGAHLFQKDEVPEEVLVERIRSAIGRAVTHPSSIEVSAKGGQIILSGSVPEHEHSRLLDRVRKVRGVRSIESRIEAKKTRIETGFRVYTRKTGT